MPPVLDPSKSKVDGLAFLGLSLARKSQEGNAESETHQTAFDLNQVLDREYEHIFSTNDDGWLVGGGEPSSSYKLAAKDSAHVEIMRIGTYEASWGGISQAEIIQTLQSGQILIPEMKVVPTAVVANGDSPPELEIRFDMEQDQDNEDGLPVNWQLRFVHNQLFEHFQFPSRFCPGAFHSTIVRKAEFRSKEHETAYFEKCSNVVADWRQAGPQSLRAPSRSGIEAVHCKSNHKIVERDCAPFDSFMETVDDFLTPTPLPEVTSGLYLFRDRNTITHYFTPNFEPNTPEKLQLVRDVISECWDERTLSWNQNVETTHASKEILDCRGSRHTTPSPETLEDIPKAKLSKRERRGRGKSIKTGKSFRSGLFRMRRTPQGIVEEIPVTSL